MPLPRNLTAEYRPGARHRLRPRHCLAGVVDDLDKLPYAALVVKEILRLYPLISRIGRSPLDDVTLGSVRV